MSPRQTHGLFLVSLLTSTTIEEQEVAESILARGGEAHAPPASETRQTVLAG